MERNDTEKFSIDHKFRSSSFRMKDSHSHPYFELYYLISGQRKFFIDQKIYNIQARQLILIPPQTLHRTTFATPAPHERMVIMFGSGFLSPLADAYGKNFFQDVLANPQFTLPEDQRPILETLLTSLAGEQENPDLYSPRLIRSHIENLILLLVRLRQTSTASANLLSSSDCMVEQAAAFINRHFSLPITLKDAADAAGLSPSYFSRKFKETTGFGFKEYLNQIRLKKASQALLSTSSSITDIALACGFPDSNYFGDLFRKAVGVSPREFRKQAGKVEKKEAPGMTI